MIDTIVLRWHGINDLREDPLNLQAIKNVNDPESQDPFLEYRNPGLKELYEKLYNAKNNIEGSIKHVKKSFQFEDQGVSPGRLQFADLSRHITGVHKNPKNPKYGGDFLLYKFGTREKVIQKGSNVKQKIESSSYVMNIRLEPERNFIEFNFSIPKYLFGHNLAQFIPQRGSMRFYDNPLLSEFPEQAKILHERLGTFIARFIKKLKRDWDLQYPMDETLLEINRIDMCYNEIYPTKEDALIALAYKFQIDRSRQSDRSNVIRIKNETLQYNSHNGLNCKIYHKGSEYIKNDYPKHQEINRKGWLDYLADQNALHEFKHYTRKIQRLDKIATERKLNRKTDFLDADGNHDPKLIKLYKRYRSIRVFDVDHLKKESDRILRYEVSFKGRYFYNLYKRKVYRRTDPDHRKWMELYNKIHASKNTIGSDDGYTAQERVTYYNIKRFLEKKCVFMYRPTRQMDSFTKEVDPSRDYPKGAYDPKMLSAGTIGDLERFDQAYFSRGFLGVIYRVFNDFVHHYELSNIDPDTNFEELVKRYNLKVEQNVKEYNELHAYLVDLYNKNPVNQGKAKKRYAVDLLTSAQKSKKDLKKINAFKLHPVWEGLKKGQSLDEVFNRFKNRSAKSRYKADLEKLQIAQNSVIQKQVQNPEISFNEYYTLTSDSAYTSRFFVSQKHNQLF